MRHRFCACAMDSKYIFIEPFYGGSHRQLVDLLVREFGGSLFTLPASKWHWRMRVSALHFAMTIPQSARYRSIHVGSGKCQNQVGVGQGGGPEIVVEFIRKQLRWQSTHRVDSDISSFISGIPGRFKAHCDSAGTLGVMRKVLFASSVLNLCELVSLRPDLATLHKVLYFHENQLIYPVRKQQDRDFQYGYNEILSCLVADVVLFNSHFNMTSFLTSIDVHLKLMPDFRPKLLADKIRPKCRVIYFPLELPPSLEHTLPCPTSKHSTKHNKSDTNEKQEVKLPLEVASVSDKSRSETYQVSLQNTPQRGEGDCDVESLDKSPCFLVTHASRLGSIEPSDDHRPLHIVWPHRWEHDKGPEEFCSVLLKLIDAKVDFHVSILGMHTKDIPPVFRSTFPLLGNRLLHHEYVEKDEYWKVLQQADVVLSTAKHEFFGIAMLEGVICGCYPLCPNRFVYPEIYPYQCLYNTEQQLFKRLHSFCKYPHLTRMTQLKLDISKYVWDNLRPDYNEALLG